MVQWHIMNVMGEDNDKAFEKLCYQIAYRLYGNEGPLIPVDDSGGGHGVEFYLQLPNGEKWGWQCKFFYPNERLNVSNRKTQIRRSLKKACQVEKSKLTRWILCTPTRFTQDEQKWFDEELPLSIPQGCTVRHWSSWHIEMWLAQPDFAGIRLHFFGELELSLEWFKTQLERHGTAARKDFEPLLHTTTHVDERIPNCLGGKYFFQGLGERINALKTAVGEAEQALRALTNRPIPNLEWHGINQRCTEVGSGWLTEAKAIAERLERAQSYLLNGDLSSIQEYDWLGHIAPLTEGLDGYDRLTRQMDTDPPGWSISSTNSEELVRANQLARELLSEPLYAAYSVKEAIDSALRALHCVKQPDLTVFGEAGVGKTHIVYNLCSERLQAGFPALYLSGRSFVSDRPLTEQLRSLLDIPSNYSWSDFLAALSTAARVYRTRIPLVIDGLNEVGRIPRDDNVWSKDLPGLVAELRRAPGVLLVTTVRSSYREPIWGDYSPENSVDCRGFSPAEVREAVQRYFDHYRIEADLSDAPIEQFQHPIYLRIFCQITNPERREVKQIHVGEQSLFEVFKAYLHQVNERVCKRLGLHPSARVVDPALAKMAQRLWESRARSVLLTEFMGYLDESLAGVWEGSKTQVIIDEGLIADRDWRQSGEVVFFTYDFLGGYVIARRLFQQNARDLAGFVNSVEFSENLLPESWGQGHPLMEDIGRCFAALVAVRTGRHLHELNDRERVLNHSVPVIFEIPPGKVTEPAVELIQQLFERPSNRIRLLRLARPVLFQPQHPLNMTFWTERLKGLSMAERDTSWTEFIREDMEQAETTVKRLEELCRAGAILPTPHPERMALMAQYVMWLMTSTVRPLRDLATRALYWYGRHYPEPFFRQVVASLEINDPYVPERMLGAASGVCMAFEQERRECSESLANFGQQIYQAIFAPQAPHATTHILMRDYARRVVKVAATLSPSLFTQRELARTRPPYKSGGIRRWGRSKDPEGQIAAHLFLDFGNYTLGNLVKGRAPYDFRHPEYRLVRANLVWRLYDLGYSLVAFDEIDKELARYSRYQDQNEGGRRTEFYGQKYNWIAYHEIAGYRADRGLLESDANAFLDIDISFPEQPHSHRLVTESFLGLEIPDTKDWVVHGGLPPIEPYLVVPQFLGEEGPWVLLDGYINEVSDALQRNRFTFLRAFFVPKRDLNALMERLESSKVDDGWLRSKHRASTIFAADLPPESDKDFDPWSEMRFKIGTKSKVFVPVVDAGWGTQISVANPSWEVTLPVWEIVDDLGLSSRPQTFGFFGQDGRKAALYAQDGEPLKDRQRFLYFRQDLLDRYLAKHGFTLIWIIHGERRWWTADVLLMLSGYSSSSDDDRYRVFKKVKVYPP